MDPSAFDVSRSVYDRLVRRGAVPAPRVRSWDGREFGPSHAASTVVLQHPGALRAVLLPPSDLTAGEAYVYDDIDLEGDIFAMLEWAASVADHPPGFLGRLRIARDLRRLPEDSRRAHARRPGFRGRRHTKRRDSDAVSYHYDTGNDFFELFLGDTMAYSCAYFLDPDEDLDTAQNRKIDLVCRKLELRSGMRLLDIGCGWGALVAHAAAVYGVDAVGVTASGEQAEYARRLIKEMGLDDRVEILHGDYRDVTGTFDAIASVGMVEHVGRNRLDEYFTTCRTLLATDGSFLNHGITTRNRSRTRRQSFIDTYVFPDGELVPIDVVLAAAEGAGFETRDVESLRMSYARTLRHWVANLEKNRVEATSATSDSVYRIWRLYMAASALGFESGHLGVYQALLCNISRPWRYGRRQLLAAEDA
jgi:cyclopropane-fatty-acyl-phospholipid synthase